MALRAAMESSWCWNSWENYHLRAQEVVSDSAPTTLGTGREKTIP